MSEPTILTGKDFTGGSLTRLTPCTLVIAHADLVGTNAAEGDAPSDGRDLLAIALGVAEDIADVQVGLLNCLDHPEVAEKLSVYVSEFGTQCAALIYTEALRPHVIAAGSNETPETFHHWVLGILLAWGHRPAITREDIILRLAYDLAQPPEIVFPDPRWDDKEVRTLAIADARSALGLLYEDWVPGFDAANLE